MDSKDKINCSIGVLALLVSLVAADSKPKLVFFSCSVDVCNRDGKPQFCATDKRCSNCEDYPSRCGTWQMSTNCSDFCWELKTKETLDRTCSPPWKIPNGHVEVSPTINGRHLSGTTLTFVCDEGFKISGNNNFTCNDQGQWSPDSTTPSCIQVFTSSQSAMSMGLVVGIVVLSVAFITSCGVNIYLWKKGKRTSAKSTTYQVSPSNGRADEEVPIMKDFNEGVHKNESEPNIGNGNGQSVVVKVNNVMYQHFDVPRGTNNDMSDTNNGDANTDNTDVKTHEGETCTPIEPSNVLTDSSVPDPSHNNEEDSTKFPIQVETPDEIKGNGTIAELPRNEQKKRVCQESVVANNKEKVALGENTVDNGDMANKLR